NPLHTVEAIQSVPQLAERPSAPRRKPGRKTSRRASTPGARLRTVAHQKALHSGSEYSASERPVLTFTGAHRAPKESVVAFATPNRPPVAPSSVSASSHRNSQRAPRSNSKL